MARGLALRMDHGSQYLSDHFLLFEYDPAKKGTDTIRAEIHAKGSA